MAYENKPADSDSASLGSNPSSPATKNPDLIGFQAVGQTGHTGTEGAYWTHSNRHNCQCPIEFRCKALEHEFKQLNRLFTSKQEAWGKRYLYQDLRTLIEARAEGTLGIHAHWVPPALIDKCSRFDAMRLRNRSESPDHIWLKRIGRAWLQHQFGVKPTEEFWFCGYRADVAIPDLRIVLECGNTNCNGAKMAFVEPAYRYFLLPFSTAATRWLEEDWNRDTRPRIAIFEITLTDIGRCTEFAHFFGGAQ